MPTRRVPLLSLLALILTVGLIAGCGSGDKGGGSGGGGGGDDAASLLKKAFLTQPKSGSLKLDMTADLTGSSSLKGPIKVSIGGPFKSLGRNKLPEADWKYAFSGSGTGLDGKLILTKDNGYFSFRGQTFEIGQDQYKQLAGQAESNSAQNEKIRGKYLHGEEWLKDPKVATGESIGGDSTKRITGSLDVEKMVGDLAEFSQNSAIQKQLQRQGRTTSKLSDDQIKQVTDALEDPKFSVNVDGENRLRKASFTAKFKVPEGSGSSSMAPTGGTIAVSLAFPELGTNPTIEAPSGAKPLQLLLQQFGMGAGGLGGLKTN